MPTSVPKACNLTIPPFELFFCHWESQEIGNPQQKSGLQLHHHCFSIIFAFILARNQGGPIPHFHMVFAVRRAECTQQYAQCSTGAAQCGHASTEPGGFGDGGFSLADLSILNSSGKHQTKLRNSMQSLSGVSFVIL